MQLEQKGFVMKTSVARHYGVTVRDLITFVVASVAFGIATEALLHRAGVSHSWTVAMDFGNTFLPIALLVAWGFALAHLLKATQALATLLWGMGVVGYILANVLLI